MSNLEFFKSYSSIDLSRHSNITCRVRHKKYQIFNVQSDFKNLNINKYFLRLLKLILLFLEYKLKLPSQVLQAFCRFILIRQRYKSYCFQSDTLLYKWRDTLKSSFHSLQQLPDILQFYFIQ